MRALCELDEIAENGARSFMIGTDDGELEIFIVRQGARCHAYVNRCPHTRAPLNWLPDQFLSEDASLIQCANHDARFRIEDGVCIAGPCAGDRLSALAVTVRDGRVWLAGGAG